MFGLMVARGDRLSGVICVGGCKYRVYLSCVLLSDYVSVFLLCFYDTFFIATLPSGKISLSGR